MAIRPILIKVGLALPETAASFSYPIPDSNGYNYRVPLYRVSVSGTDASGSQKSRDFSGMRFGLHNKTGDTSATRMVGLKDGKLYTIKRWIPDYKTHSHSSPEDGAWQVYGNFLIHDGPDDPANPSAVIGCVAIIGGPAGFIEFNDYIISLSGSTKTTRSEKLSEIGASGALSALYLKTERPPIELQP
ncbi:MAG TPA: hypothetical protein ENK31_10165, partial [Nannocystis exedens]|nr:hypothetical protein [Nannocystis exedens]